MKLVLIKIDKGDVWEITGTTVQEDSFVEDDTVMVINNKNLFDYIKDKLEFSQVQISKKVKGNLIKEDLIEIEYDPMQVYKERTIHAGREYLSSRLNVATLFDFVDFIMSNNVLISNGFAITPENKKDMFIKIIESENVELINALDKYTTIQNKLQVINGWWRTFKDFEKRVYNSTTKEEIDNCYKIFVQIFG